MNIFILTEGGRNIGFGHLTRCISLYQAFEKREIMPELIVNGDGSIEDLLRGKNYRIFNWLKEENKLFKMVGNADIVIIDSYLADKSLYYKISGVLVNGRLVMIDDYNRIEYPAGIIVNPSIHGDKLNYRQKDGVVYLLGKNYIVLRKEFWRPLEKIINKEVKNILITFGGINHSDLIYKIIDYLKKRSTFRFNCIDAKKDRVDAQKILDLMVNADICISGGGQTIYELARCGVPTIGICFGENQLLNLRGWTKEGFLKFGGWFNDKNLYYKIKNYILEMDYKARLKMSKIGQKFINGQGARKITEESTKGYRSR